MYLLPDGQHLVKGSRHSAGAEHRDLHQANRVAKPVHPAESQRPVLRLMCLRFTSTKIQMDVLPFIAYFIAWPSPSPRLSCWQCETFEMALFVGGVSSKKVVEDARRASVLRSNETTGMMWSMGCLIP